MNWRNCIRRFMIVTRTHLLVLLMFALLLLSVARGYIIQSILPPASEPGGPSLSHVGPGR
ncbi:MAG: hypothetical protein ABIJ00_02840 [Candidatus Eisenbacteria bacterium]